MKVNTLNLKTRVRIWIAPQIYKVEYISYIFFFPDPVPPVTSTLPIMVSVPRPTLGVLLWMYVIVSRSFWKEAAELSSERLGLFLPFGHYDSY